MHLNIADEMAAEWSGKLSGASPEAIAYFSIEEATGLLADRTTLLAEVERLRGEIRKLRARVESEPKCTE